MQNLVHRSRFTVQTRVEMMDNQRFDQRVLRERAIDKMAHGNLSVGHIMSYLLVNESHCSMP